MGIFTIFGFFLIFSQTQAQISFTRSRNPLVPASRRNVTTSDVVATAPTCVSSLGEAGKCQPWVKCSIYYSHNAVSVCTLTGGQQGVCCPIVLKNRGIFILYYISSLKT